jgi:hypothetical protein
MLFIFTTVQEFWIFLKMAGLMSLLSYKMCLFRTRSARMYVAHCGLHYNGPNSMFPCGYSNCVRTFSSYVTFEKHFSEIHGKCRKSRHDWRITDVSEHQVSYLCDIQHCREVCSNLKLFIVHLREHVKSNTAVNCPFENCSKRFEGVVESTFNSHISRFHKHSSRACLKNVHLIDSVDNVAAPVSDVTGGAEDTSVAEDGGVDCNKSVESQPVFKIESMLLKKTALLSLGLQVKHHVPSSTVQTVMSEVGDLVNHNMSAVIDSVHDIMVNGGVADDLATQVIKAMQTHPLCCTLDPQQGPMRSHLSRLSYYKKAFRYIEPVSMKLFDPGNPVKVYHYVPIAETLKSLFKDANIACHLKNLIVDTPSSGTQAVLKDFDDGSVYKADVFVKTTPDCINLLLYQDEFELVNPLGSAKGKHKMFAVYYTVGNLHANRRSKIDGLQLALLCKHKDLVKFGIQKVLDPLMLDLQVLQTKGINLGGTFGIRKARVMFVLGDNLGSHMIGGFTENFSGKFFCRYCLATGDCLDSGECKPDNFEKRTSDNYQSAIEHLAHDNVDNYEGIKANSVLHRLPGFHVCAPALPPCLGHDLFEGVVPSDLTLCFQYLIKQKKWFSVAYLNKRIDSVKLMGSEANDKPPYVNNLTLKVSGHAVQMWTFLRFIPILIGHKIEDTTDEVWQMILLLRDVVELICAPTVTTDTIAYMKDSLEEYIERRVKLFPQTRLKPKHHFLLHYPDLTLQCGPLIRLWTLRFEGKHSYFKNCGRTAKNFINITKTQSEKHQLLQAFYSSGSLFGQSVTFANGLPFHIEVHS